MRISSRQALQRLARAWGIQARYVDARGERRSATPEQLVAVLRTLGVPIGSVEDATTALRERTAQSEAPGLDSVHVAWDGRMPPLRGNLPQRRALEWRLHVDTGETREWQAEATRARSRGGAAPAWNSGVRDQLPPGYHVLEVHAGRDSFETFVISAPRRAYVPPGRSWGVFLPLHAVHSSNDIGIGEYTDLADLALWVARLGGSWAGTLPLLATFLRSPFEPSPYAPVSRLFWNDLFIDPQRLRGGARAEIVAGREILRVRDGRLVDYARVAQVKREIIDAIAHDFFDAGGDRRSGFLDYLEKRPLARDYARFRAVADRLGVGWTAWPERLRDGDLQPGDYDERDERYHLFTAWTAERQLGDVATAARGQGVELYLDLPLGVNRDGFDPWRMPGLFALDASAGAPPDLFFGSGQDWGFPPMNPHAMRADRFAYLIDCLRNHLRFAGALRLDHVMALQRLYWIPRGLAPTEGVYVRYPLDELFAILTLESARYRAAIIGEDLGTVSREIRSAMNRHGVQRMFVLQFEALPDRATPLPDRVPRSVIASLNTHDMPTFAAYWDALDIDDRRDLGLLRDDDVEQETAARARVRSGIAAQLRITDGARANGGPPADVALTALLDWMAASPARILLINLEDLWLETEPQNVPGTSTERPNWRRRARFSLEQIRDDVRVNRMLEHIAQLRRNTKTHG